ncbi:glycosyltransferase involved in cell wall biosynthesis [Bradyrhizobium sp. i1.7.7]
MLTELPLISLVTPTYNRSKYLPETVNSVLNQSYPNIEFIIVDDGSTDSTGEYLATLPPTVKVLRQSNAGQVAALTAGWGASTGTYLGYLSDDDILLPDAVATLVKHLEAEPEAVATFPNTNLIDQKRQGSQGARGPAVFPGRARDRTRMLHWPGRHLSSERI